jgi:aminocarboxymuconate-semialdehyde decarboxylase
MPGSSIDIHTHILTQETMALLARESPRVAPILKEMREDSAALMEIDGKIMQKHVPRGLWDVEWRLRDMDANDVDVQLLSPTTQTFFYEVEDGLGAACAALQNDQIAKTVARHPRRFIGLAALPLQAPARAADELKRAMTTLGLRGAEIGSNVCARNLDDPQLEPVWATAEELGAFILVHPHNFAARERLQSYYLSNFVGLPFETTLAATSLVFGGVLARHPKLTFCFSHGGGYVPYHAWLGGAAGAQAAFAGRPPAVAVAPLFRQHRAFEAHARISGRHRRLRARPARQRLSLRYGQSRLRRPRPRDRRAAAAARQHSRCLRAAAAALAAARLDTGHP